MSKKSGLKIIPLGGAGEVTKNMYVYEYGNEIIVVDCGIGFPEMEMLGVDILIPDISYLKARENKIRGFIITQGHYDHYGALPYILPQFKRKFPIYSTKLVQGFISSKLKEFNLLDMVDLKHIHPEDGSFKLGSFRIDAFRVNHSVPDTVGFVIRTPVGKIVHVSDFKFDWTPVYDKPFDVRKLSQLVNNDASVLLSDCLGSLSEGYTKSEKDIEKSFDRLLDDAVGQVFITTISSNISRIQQAVNSSYRHGRRVVFLGKSITDNVRVARSLGYLKVPKDSIKSLEQATGYPPDKLTYLVAGSYGQKNSALFRIAEDNFKGVKIKKEAMVIFSADPSPPGVKDSVDAVVNKLTNLGADVHHYEIQENLHVSGHGLQGDLLMLARIVNPKYFIPIGGTSSMMRGYSKLMEKAGYKSDRVFELDEGDVVVLKDGSLSRIENGIKTVNVFVDGLGVGDVGTSVLRDRNILAEGGVLIIVIPVSKKEYTICGDIKIASRGFVFVKESSWLLGEIEKIALDVATKHLPKKDMSRVKRKLEERVSKFVFKETERRPLVLPTLLLV